MSKYNMKNNVKKYRQKSFVNSKFESQIISKIMSQNNVKKSK